MRGAVFQGFWHERGCKFLNLSASVVRGRHYKDIYSSWMVTEVIAALGDIGITTTAEELIDLSLLDEVYAEQPDLKA